MPYEEQLLAGANDFDGTAGRGLFTFADMALFPSLAYGAKVLSLYCNCDGIPPLIQIYEGFTATPAAQRRLIWAGTGNSVGLNCEFVVPKTDLNVLMNVYVISTGKSADGRCELHWTPGIIL